MPTADSFQYSCRSLSEIKEYILWAPEKIQSLKINKKDVVFFDGVDIPTSMISSESSEAVILISANQGIEWSQLSPKVVLIDHIQDPRNLGAIIRSCAFFGVEDVIVPRDRQVHLSETTIRTSAGGFSRVRLTVETNLNQCLSHLKSHGFWIIGTQMDGTDIRDVRKDFDRLAVVFGSEEKGISSHVLKKCDLVVSIAGSGLESLNVAVACGIVLHQFSPK
jgi:predicted rRNA methylase